MISEELKRRLACEPSFTFCLEGFGVRVVDYMGAVFLGLSPSGGPTEWAQLGVEGARSLAESLTYRASRAALYDPAGEESAVGVREKARETYRRWYRGLDTADCGMEASHFEEGLDELLQRPERLVAVLTETIEWLGESNQDAVPEFLVLREKARRAGYVEVTE